MKASYGSGYTVILTRFLCARQLYEEQAPIAVVLACSDSRCPPEMVFDQGLGDLLVVRCAEKGSIFCLGDLIPISRILPEALGLAEICEGMGLSARKLDCK